MSAEDDYPWHQHPVPWEAMCDEIDRLWEQLARQAPVVEAAKALRDANTSVLEAPLSLRATAAASNDWDAAEIALYTAVRALSVPAPPPERWHWGEVFHDPEAVPAPPEAKGRVVHLSAGDQEAIAEALLREWGVRPMSDWIRPPAPSTGDRA